MPIVEIEIILKPNETIQGELAAEFAEVLGGIFSSPAGGTWVKVYGLLEENYAENGGREANVFPVFVSILKSKLPTSTEMQMEVDQVVKTVARICGRPPENIHVLYEPEGKGRVAFGGKIVT